MAPYYPVYLDLKGRTCVVIGAGKEAEGKLASLIECGAKVKMISPEVTEDIRKLAQEGIISWEQRGYKEGDLKGTFLAIAAINDNSVNRKIVQEAAEERSLLNVVDVTHLCTFIAPAVVRRGDVTVAISTSGLSPALARKLREELQASPVMNYADMTGLIAEVRQELRKEGARIDPEHWQACLNQEVLQLFRQDPERARARLKESLLQGAAYGGVPIP